MPIQSRSIALVESSNLKTDIPSILVCGFCKRTMDLELTMCLQQTPETKASLVVIIFVYPLSTT